MSLTQSEIMETLGLAKMGGSRAVNALSSMDLDTLQLAAIFTQFAGDVERPANRILRTVVSYLVYDAAMGKPLDVTGCINRAEALAAREPSMFSDAGEAERDAAKAQARADREARLAAMKAESASKPREVVNEDGTVSRRRGRPPAGVASAFDRVADMWKNATDRSKEGFIAAVQQALGMGHGSAQTYYYKCKKEIKVA